MDHRHSAVKNVSTSEEEAEEDNRVTVGRRANAKSEVIRAASMSGAVVEVIDMMRITIIA